MSAIHALDRIKIYNPTMQLPGLDWHELLRHGIMSAEGADDVFRCLSLAKRVHGKEQADFDEEAKKLLSKLFEEDKIHKQAADVSLIGLEFAAKWGYALEMEIDVLGLINEIFDSLYLALNNENEERRNALMQLANVLPDIHASLVEDMPVIYHKLKETKLEMEEPRVVSQIHAKFETVLKSSVHALIKSEDKFYFSGEFSKPGSRCISFNVNDLARHLDIGFTVNFSSVFYSLAGRPTKKTIDLSKVKDTLEKVEKSKLGDGLSLGRQLLQS